MDAFGHRVASHAAYRTTSAGHRNYLANLRERVAGRNVHDGITFAFDPGGAALAWRTKIKLSIPAYTGDNGSRVSVVLYNFLESEGIIYKVKLYTTKQSKTGSI